MTIQPAQHVTGTDAPRIGYVMTHYPKLAQTFIRSEIEGLRSRGFEVSTMAMNACEPTDMASPADLAERDATTYLKSGGRSQLQAAMKRATKAGLMPTISALGRAGRHGGIDLRSKLWRGFHLAEAIIVWDRCNADGIRHIHSQFAGPTATIAQLAAQLGTAITPNEPWTTSISIHGSTDFYNEDSLELDSKAAQASFVAVVSDYLRAQCMRTTDTGDWDKIKVVRVGIDHTRFARRPPRELGTPPRICSVGRLSSEKGQVVLIDAIGELRRRGVEVAVDMIGDGPLKETMLTMSTDFGVDDLITFHGELRPDEVAQSLARSDVFCISSFMEGIPVSAMEAMAVGVPVVAHPHTMYSMISYDGK